ncbi:AAA ATPase (plasmid) [Cupriavidus taiwanensis]|uniref:AAA ATPase n=1 Tax=Cupriavidus taiwanensis TaxID=164546 RepID=A0A375ECN8_9BURK|nr:ATP-binding protein [Cupriavidus taiwanensis]SOZ72655.1 AAA ATPase [Cupriavidus taiwanensis]SOZ73314.1 AAA ATPase [Cupriavidus taiwanensis]SOZ75188.1 AAA ATPase [Cupriavidus taiwanensis]SPA03704.1 AAA ATPase [Cupriavidus taiwanensis]SPA11607.1 AAA ATPase [Cupriavidus taiwanensis]
MELNPSQLQKLLAACIPAMLPVLVAGAPGIGKSDIVARAASDAGSDLLISHPVVEDPTDSKGLPFPSADGAHARFLPFGDLERALSARRPLVWFIDDLGQATPAVQAAKMQLLLARKIGEHVLPPHVTFVAATNRRIDNAGVSNILDPLKSRFATIVELTTSIEDWTRWAVATGQPPELIAFLRFRPDLLLSANRTREIENLPSPRSWGMVGKLSQVVPAELEHVTFAGAVGQGAATEFVAFKRLFRQMPSPDGVLAAPSTAPIPTDVAVQYGIVTALARLANANNFDRVMVYANRLHEAGLGEFAVLLVRDAVERDASIASTPAFIVAQGGPIGAHIRGQ